jgi:hypothetical protein
MGLNLNFVCLGVIHKKSLSCLCLFKWQTDGDYGLWSLLAQFIAMHFYPGLKTHDLRKLPAV